MNKTKINKKDLKVVNDTSSVEEENLPVLNLEDCETFDPSAEKSNRQQSEDEWEDDIDDNDDYID